MFIWGHTLVHLMSSFETALGRSACFILRLIANPFRLATKKIFLPYISCCMHHCWSLPSSRFVLFFKVRRTTPWTLGEILRAPLCSRRYPFDCFMSGIFGGGSKVVVKLVEKFHAIKLECSVQYSWCSLILWPVWCVHLIDLIMQRSCGIILLPWLHF